MPAAQRADGAAGARIQQVHGEQRRDQHRDPDDEINLTGTDQLNRSDAEWRNAGDAVVAAEEFELAEQIEQAMPQAMVPSGR